MTSINRTDGYLLVDHRGSPGVPDSMVTRVGLPPGAGHGVFEAATMHCKHCSAVVVKNPLRARPREFCRTCNSYVCDGCAASMAAADYVHRTFEDLAHLVSGGHFTVSGNPSAPILKPTGDHSDG